MATRPRNVSWVIGLDCDIRRIVVCIICRFVAGLTIVQARCRFDEFGSKAAGVRSVLVGDVTQQEGNLIPHHMEGLAFG